MGSSLLRAPPQKTLEEALSVSERLVRLVRHSGVFSDNERYKEHSAGNLRLVLAWAYRADLLQRMCVGLRGRCCFCALTAHRAAGAAFPRATRTVRTVMRSGSPR